MVAKISRKYYPANLLDNCVIQMLEIYLGMFISNDHILLTRSLLRSTTLSTASRKEGFINKKITLFPQRGERVDKRSEVGVSPLRRQVKLFFHCLMTAH